MIVSKYFVGGGLWRWLNINLFITSARPLKSIFSQQNILIQSLTLYTQNNCSISCWWKTVEVYKIAKMYIEYVVYSPFLALSV
jgi:hypothetical protein